MYYTSRSRLVAAACVAFALFPGIGKMQAQFGNFTSLHSFPADGEGDTPSSVIQDTDGSFYGTTIDTVSGSRPTASDHPALVYRERRRRCQREQQAHQGQRRQLLRHDQPGWHQ